MMCLAFFETALALQRYYGNLKVLLHGAFWLAHHLIYLACLLTEKQQLG